jgi:hypothetical protein
MLITARMRKLLVVVLGALPRMNFALTQKGKAMKSRNAAGPMNRPAKMAASAPHAMMARKAMS